MRAINHAQLCDIRCNKWVVVLKLSGSLLRCFAHAGALFGQLDDITRTQGSAHVTTKLPQGKGGF